MLHASSTEPFYYRPPTPHQVFGSILKAISHGLDPKPTTSARRDCAGKRTGKARRAARAGCPCKRRNAVQCVSLRNPEGAGRFWPIATLLVAHDGLHRTLLAPCAGPKSAPSRRPDVVGFGSSVLNLKFAPLSDRHPELVSGFISPHAPPFLGAGWMLKQVQGDGV